MVHLQLAEVLGERHHLPRVQRQPQPVALHLAVVPGELLQVRREGLRGRPEASISPASPPTSTLPLPSSPPREGLAPTRAPMTRLLGRRRDSQSEHRPTETGSHDNVNGTGVPGWGGCLVGP